MNRLTSRLRRLEPKPKGWQDPSELTDQELAAILGKPLDQLSDDELKLFIAQAKLGLEALEADQNLN